jgi:hypothetical protein
MAIFFPQNERMQGFVEELGEPVSEPSTWTSSRPPPLERAIAAAQRWGIGFVGPLPGSSPRGFELGAKPNVAQTKCA